MSALRELTHLGAVVADPVGRARVVACVTQQKDGSWRLGEDGQPVRPHHARPRPRHQPERRMERDGAPRLRHLHGQRSVSASPGLHMALREMWQAVEAGVGLRLAATFAIHQARAVADFAHAEAGATAIFESGPFERGLRGLYAVTQQVQARKIHFGTVGQQLTGLSPNPCFF